MYSTLLLLSAVVMTSVRGLPVFFFPQTVTYETAPFASHHAVEQNAANEALLPRELLKSKDFYDNPHVAAGLAKESWFTNKEMPVLHREAERIPREQIYKIVKNAGFLESNKPLYV